MRYNYGECETCARKVDYFSVKAGAVEVKMDATRRKVFLDNERKNG